MQCGSLLNCSVVSMRAVLAQLGRAEGWKWRPVHATSMGEDLASVFPDSQCVACSGCSLGGSESYSSTVFPQLLASLCSGMQMYLFPVFWSRVNCVETGKFDEKS